MSFEDSTRPPRPGEELDAARLAGYLRGRIPALTGELGVTQFPSGHSNLTYLLRMGGEEFVLRRPPFGKIPKTGHDMHREWTVLSALSGHYPYAPEPLLYCDDLSVLGAPFFIMRRLRGLILRRDLPEGLGLSAGAVRTLCERLVQAHRALHALDYRSLGLEEFGKPQGYVERQIAGWSRRYRDARTPDAPDFEEVMAWLEARRPPERGAALVHNDFRLDNVVLDPLDPTRIIGVLDWEMAAIGDPLMDLGASLAYWVQADDPPELRAIRVEPTTLPGALTRREVVALYLDGAGLAVEDATFYYIYGLFRLAGIAQQIYYRFYHGQTQDPRFGPLVQAVRVLEATARRAMVQGMPLRVG
ncbi:MAG: phosphotransferase family protein [Acidobacteriota bacterium]